MTVSPTAASHTSRHPYSLGYHTAGISRFGGEQEQIRIMGGRKSSGGSINGAPVASERCANDCHFRRTIAGAASPQHFRRQYCHAEDATLRPLFAGRNPSHWAEEVGPKATAHVLLPLRRRPAAARLPLKCHPLLVSLIPCAQHRLAVGAGGWASVKGQAR